jgi:hypothetical protein
LDLDFVLVFPDYEQLLSQLSDTKVSPKTMLVNGVFALFSRYGYYATAGKVPGLPQATLRTQPT